MATDDYFLLGRLSAAPVQPETLQKAGGSDQKRLYEASVEFEAVFIEQMLKAMRQTVVKGDLFHGGPGEEIYEDWLYGEYAKEMARSRCFGLADVLYQHLAGFPRQTK